MDLSLIIPAYNEENRIGATVQAYVEYLRKTDLQFELIVEMDGCTDRTAEIVKELAATYPEIRVVEFHKKLGKGGGIEKAMPYATGKVVGFVDADCSVQPEEFQKLLPPVVDGYDAAISSRRAKGESSSRGCQSRGRLPA